ncbi:MAG TPA: hypothetical protein PJ988_00650 [Anaerolinea sp.]|nr:hypothetical protein [Anaerolinea sp.]
MPETSSLIEIILHVKDLPGQLAFYRDTLGLAVKNDDGQPFARAELVAGACSLVGDATLPPVPPQTRPRLVFKVSDVEQKRVELAAKGVRIGPLYSPKAGLTACDGSDLEGNLFSLQSSSEPVTTTTIIPNVSVPHASSRRIWAV